MKLKSTMAVVAGASALGLLLTGCGGGGGGAESGGGKKTVTHVEWGGVSQKIGAETLWEPWAKEAGVTLAEDQPTDYAKLDAMVKSGKVTWGVVEVEPNFAESACADGTLTKLSDRVQQAARDNDVDPELMGECGMPILQYAFTIGYNTDKFASGHPTTWAEFFDTEKFPGKRGMWKYPTGGIFEAALIADGVAPDKLYPLDLDRAFKKLDTIKDDIVWYDTGDQQTQLLASGEAPLVQAWNGRVFQAQQDGQPVANEYGENFGTYEQMVIPKGYANAELAEDWMVWILGNHEAQANYSKRSSYGPVTPGTFDLLSEDEQSELANSPANREKMSALIDYKYWADNYAEVSERMNVWMAS